MLHSVTPFAGQEGEIMKIIFATNIAQTLMDIDQTAFLLSITHPIGPAFFQESATY